MTTLTPLEVDVEMSTHIRKHPEMIHVIPLGTGANIHKWKVCACVVDTSFRWCQSTIWPIGSVYNCSPSSQEVAYLCFPVPIIFPIALFEAMWKEGDLNWKHVKVSYGFLVQTSSRDKINWNIKQVCTDPMHPFNSVCNLSLKFTVSVRTNTKLSLFQKCVKAFSSLCVVIRLRYYYLSLARCMATLLVRRLTKCHRCTTE